MGAPDPTALPPRCVVDTNVFSYLARGGTRAEPYRASLAGRQVGVSFQTVAELRRWAIERRWGPARHRQLARQLDRVVICLVNDALMTAWAEITARLRPAGAVASDQRRVLLDWRLIGYQSRGTHVHQLGEAKLAGRRRQPGQS